MPYPPGGKKLWETGTVDKLRVNGHFYSDKPPVLPAVGATVYTGLYLTGIRFSGSPAQFVLANLVLVWTIVGISSGPHIEFGVGEMF